MKAKSTSSISQMLGYIEWKGYIKRYPAHARAITIVRETANTIGERTNKKYSKPLILLDKKYFYLMFTW